MRYMTIRNVLYASGLVPLVRGLGWFGSPAWIESSGALLGVRMLWHVIRRHSRLG